MTRRHGFMLCTTLLGACAAPVENARVETVLVNGNCSMCEETIEEAAPDGLADVDWDRNTRIAVVTYDSTRITLDGVLKKVAQAGYDNERWTAPDSVYERLPHCCQYTRTGTLISHPTAGDKMHDH